MPVSGLPRERGVRLLLPRSFWGALMTYLRLCLLAVALPIVPACGLIDSDVTNFDLTLPDKAFSVDASGWDVDQQSADTFLAMSCSGAPTICASAAMAACPMNCTGTCGSASKCE